MKIRVQPLVTITEKARNIVNGEDEGSASMSPCSERYGTTISGRRERAGVTSRGDRDRDSDVILLAPECNFGRKRQVTNKLLVWLSEGSE